MGFIERCRSLDIIGLILWIGAVMCLVLSINFGGPLPLEQWSDYRTTGPQRYTHTLFRYSASLRVVYNAVRTNIPGQTTLEVRSKSSLRRCGRL